MIEAKRLKAAATAETPAPSARRDRTRTALLRAAERLMSERSVDAVSIDEIVEEAGVAKGTFYNNFPDKDSLHQGVLELIRDDITLRIGERNLEVYDPAHRVARAFCFVLDYARHNVERGRFLVRTFMAFRLVENRMNVGLIKDISVGMGEGRFRISSTESGALLMLGVTHAALVQTLEDLRLFPTTVRAQQLCAMMLRGLGLENAEAEMIAAKEADRIICGHDFPITDGSAGPAP